MIDFISGFFQWSKPKTQSAPIKIENRVWVTYDEKDEEE